jgi:hypothetical protein
MERQARRRRPDFWRDFGGYVKGEFRSILQSAGLVLLCIFLFVSLLVGMYHVTLYLLFWIIYGVQPKL